MTGKFISGHSQPGVRDLPFFLMIYEHTLSLQSSQARPTAKKARYAGKHLSGNTERPVVVDEIVDSSVCKKRLILDVQKLIAKQ